MAELDMHIPHDLSKAEALSRIRNLLTQVKKEQSQHIADVQEKWEGDKGQFRFTAKGFDLSGVIEVTDSKVHINAQLPFALSLFKATIKKVIHDKAQTLLAKS